jgi:hypothetical protein
MAIFTVYTIGQQVSYNKVIKNRGTQDLWKTKIRVATYRIEKGT